jgi:predicted lipoprotein
MKRIIFGILIGTLVFVTACNKDKNKKEDFDKAALLQNFADHIIQPRYADFKTKIDSLELLFTAFQTNPSTGAFEDVKSHWKACYLSFQRVKTFDFGPAMNTGFKSAIGTFPTDTTQISSNIAAGTYNLSTATNADAVGLAALDYLFFNSNAYSNLTSNAAYSQYCLDVIQKMKSETDAIVSAWSSFKSTFIASTGNESTSMFSMLVNDFCQDWEEAKAAKLGIPLGKYSLGIQRPEYIEARYSGYSLPILKASLNSIAEIYSGIGTNGQDGIGFDDYLIALDKSTLNNTIKTKFQTIDGLFSPFNSTLEIELTQNQTALENLFNAISEQVVFIKTDMTASFGILITYQDNDGD